MKRSRDRAKALYGLGKRQKQAPADGRRSSAGVVGTDDALTFFRSMFTEVKLKGRFPPVIFKHQLYSVVENKTTVDREINGLREKKEIKLFHVDNENENCLVFTSDYKDCLRNSQKCASTITERFITLLVEGSTDLSFDRKDMQQFGFKENEITQLLHAGFLTVRDVGSWWLAFPDAGIFMKCHRKGREAMLRTIRLSRHKEVLLQELEGKKLQAVEPLGVKYHIHDILGAEHVTRIQTTSGVLLRYDV